MPKENRAFVRHEEDKWASESVWLFNGLTTGTWALSLAPKNFGTLFCCCCCWKWTISCWCFLSCFCWVALSELSVFYSLEKSSFFFFFFLRLNIWCSRCCFEKREKFEEKIKVNFQVKLTFPLERFKNIQNFERVFFVELKIIEISKFHSKFNYLLLYEMKLSVLEKWEKKMFKVSFLLLVHPRVLYENPYDSLMNFTVWIMQRCPVFS